MNLELDWRKYSEKDLIQLGGHLTQIEKHEPFSTAPKLSDLCGEDFDAWDKVKTNFRADFRFFDPLLFRLHFKRNVPFQPHEEYNILKFLTIGYLLSNDVRYFNEFLWFYRKGQQTRDLWLLSLDHFHKILLANRCHPFPLCTAAEVKSFVEQSGKTVGSLLPGVAPVPLPKVGLVGTPSFFKRIYRKLKTDGFPVEVFFIPYHSDKRKRSFLKSGILFRLFLLARGVTFPFTTLKFDHKDPRIQQALSDRELDIGFHKLGFIIKGNIINSFKRGLLNDHLSVLPFIRGRSTVEYSLLFGFPLGATLHVIAEEVDTGDIVKIYTYDSIIKGRATIRSVRRAIRSRMSDRAVDAIRLLSTLGDPRIPNDKSKGLTHYSIHPALSKFIETNILKPST